MFPPIKVPLSGVIAPWLVIKFFRLTSSVVRRWYNAAGHVSASPPSDARCCRLSPHQVVSGSFKMQSLDGVTSEYANVQNIVARLGPAEPSNHSVLVNCHYDTAIGSPGNVPGHQGRKSSLTSASVQFILFE